MRFLVPLFLAACVTAGARDLQQAQTPAASTSKPIADLLFVLSAGKATFTDANTLKLGDVTQTAQFYGSGARAGIIPTSVFANGTAGASYVSADGEWLNNPSATLFGFVGENKTQTSYILTLASPKINDDDETVTFSVVASTTSSAVKTTKGVANEVLTQAETQQGYLQTVIQPGTELRDPSLFVDANREDMKPIAQTKTFWWWGPGWGWGHGGGWGCGWGCGGGWGWGK